MALARELRPDVCLFDIRMPGSTASRPPGSSPGPDVDGPAGGRRDHHLRPRRVRPRRPARRAPAGFLLKDAGPELLVQAIHAAANGDALIAPNVTVRLLATFADPRAGAARRSPSSR